MNKYSFRYAKPRSKRAPRFYCEALDLQDAKDKFRTFIDSKQSGFGSQKYTVWMSVDEGDGYKAI